MANHSGIAGLVRGARAYLEANAPGTVAVHLGWVQRNRKDNTGPDTASRVVFAPGEFDVGTGGPRPRAAGRLTRDAPQQVLVNPPTDDPRLQALAWWEYPATVSVWAVDLDHPRDDEAQIEAVETLVELTIQAIHNSVDPLTGMAAGFANVIAWGDAAWTLPPGEGSFGRELVFGFTLLVPLFSAPVGIAYPAPAVARNPPT